MTNYDWEVDSDSDNRSSYYVFRIVNAQGTEEEKKAGGFLSGYFYIDYGEDPNEEDEEEPDEDEDETPGSSAAADSTSSSSTESSSQTGGPYTTLTLVTGATSPSATTGSSSDSDNDSNNDDDDDDGGGGSGNSVALGAGLGVGLGVPALVGVGALIWFYRRRTRAASDPGLQYVQYHSALTSDKPPTYSAPETVTQPVEAGDHTRQELYGDAPTTQRHELPS